MKRSKHTHARTHKEIDFTLQLVLLILVVSFNPNLVRRGEGGRNFTPSSWFSLNNSETVKAVTLTFCSIQ